MTRRLTGESSPGLPSLGLAAELSPFGRGIAVHAVGAHVLASAFSTEERCLCRTTQLDSGDPALPEASAAAAVAKEAMDAGGVPAATLPPSLPDDDRVWGGGRGGGEVAHGGGEVAHGGEMEAAATEAAEAARVAVATGAVMAAVSVEATVVAIELAAVSAGLLV